MDVLAGYAALALFLMIGTIVVVKVFPRVLDLIERLLS